jgi:hypothetical protein
MRTKKFLQMIGEDLEDVDEKECERSVMDTDHEQTPDVSDASKSKDEEEEVVHKRMDDAYHRPSVFVSPVSQDCVRSRRQRFRF